MIAALQARRFEAAWRRGRRVLPAIALAGALLALGPAPGWGQAPPSPATDIADRVRQLAPVLEAYVDQGMKAFDLPGLVIGIVAADRLVYAKGMGVRRKGAAQAVDPRTVFQIGSATKAFLATTMAMMVERGRMRWADRVIDLDPEFQLRDPWVTREFRVFDLLAQRSGLPPYANDALGILGLGEGALIRSLRYVEPVASFRSTFAYTNVTHMLAGRLVAKAAGAADWNAVLQQELLAPLGMAESSFTAAAIEAAANHARGHRWAPSGSVEIPFTQIFPYDFGGAGNINSTLEDAARWVRLQLGNGSFDGRQIVTAEALAFTRTPKVALNDRVTYALGWIVQQTPNGRIIWHNGGTTGFGAFIGFAPDKDVGVVVLTNMVNLGFPDAVGLWTFDRLLGNPMVDHAGNTLKAVTARAEAAAKRIARPASPRPAPPLPPLAGSFTNPGIGKALVTLEGDALVLELQATGARLKLDSWDGGVFAARLLPLGRFAAVAEGNGPDPTGFVQFQIDKDPTLDRLRLSLDDGQAYDFTRD